jgi:hypothetical protein
LLPADKLPEHRKIGDPVYTMLLYLFVVLASGCEFAAGAFLYLLLQSLTKGVAGFVVFFSRFANMCTIVQTFSHSFFHFWYFTIAVGRS